MTEPLQFALLGLGIGAIYALLAQGIVLIYRGSGVLNLAHGGFAMVGAYLFHELHALHGMGSAPAGLVTIAVVALLGVVTDQLLLRRLRRSSPLTRLIAMLGVLLVLQSIATLRYGAQVTIVPPLWDRHAIEIAGATITSDRLVILGIVVTLTVVLTLVVRYTRAGWVMSAVSENERAAAALGWSPNLVSATTWGVGAALAGVAGILIAPITQLSVTTMTLLVIAALAAALIGGFSSFALTLLGGLFLGIAESEVGRYVHQTGASRALPFLIIVLALILRGTSLPIRGHANDHLPSLGIGRIDLRAALPAVAAGVALLLLLSSPMWLSALTVNFAVAIIVLSIVVLTGYAGQLSLAQYALAGIGALICARLVAALDWPFELALVAGTLGAAAVGALFALPALRTRGVNLAVVTLGLGVATQELVFNNPDYTGGADGTPVGVQRLFGIDVDALAHPNRYALMVFAAFVLCAFAVANVRRSRTGRGLIAVRGNERAGAALGISVLGAKLQAFVLAGALAGLGGILLAFQSRTINFLRFDPLTSINAVAEAVIGGLGYVVGAVVGATIAPGSTVSAVDHEVLSSVDRYIPLASGVLLLVTVVAMPDGLVAQQLQDLRRLRERLRRRPAPTPPDVVLATEPPTPVAPRRLRVEGLTVRYGGVTAVDGVSLDVGPGEVVGLIGPNGAGKTSLMDAVTGFAPYEGTLRLGDEQIDGWPAHRRATAGLVRSFQSLELFEDMTVLENLHTASDDWSGWALPRDLVAPTAGSLPPIARAAIHEFGLADCLHRRPADLSYGQRRLVAVVRAIAMAPSVLLLDEPVSGLDEHESAECAALIRRIARDWGIGVFVIEHDMAFVMGICDRIVVIDFGRPIATGTPQQIRDDPAAIAAYLGEEGPADADRADARLVGEGAEG
jgi:sulfate-transporting ATPase